jgi:CheY-like chemotaxis protein
MKLLIVDDDPGMAALLARAMRKLGHEVIVGHSAGEAIHKIADADVVFVDAGLEGMSSVELVAVLRGISPNVAVCFLASADEVVHVSHVAPILPRVWTVVQVRELLSSIAKQRARGSQPKFVSQPLPLQRAASPEIIEEVPPREPDEIVPPAPPDLLEGRMPSRKVRVQCRSWEQVARLCEQHATGKTVLTLRGTYRFREGEHCVVALALPDELVLALRAECTHVRRDKHGGEVFGITLHGLTDDIRVRLERMVANAATRPMPAAQQARAISELSAD